MALQFEETTPGVNMAVWENPKSGADRTVVIIESLNTFTLYVDGDVAARDLESFEEAAARAEVMLTAGGSRRMVQIASALVVLSVVGGAAIGATHLLSGTSDLAVASTANASESRNDVVSIAPAPQNPVVINRTEAPAPVKPTVVAQAQIGDAPPAPTVAQPATVETAPAQPNARVFSATRPAFGGRETTNTATSNQPATSQVEEQQVAIAPSTAPNPYGSEQSNAAPVTSIIPPLPPRNVTSNNAQQPVEPKIAKTETAPLTTNTVNTTKSAKTAYEQLMERMEEKRNEKVGKRSSGSKKKSKTASHYDPYNSKLSYAQHKSIERAKRIEREKRIEKAKRIERAKRIEKIKRAKAHRAKMQRIRSANRRPRRVMRCMMGAGCRWVRAGGYYDRQYRRRYH